MVKLTDKEISALAKKLEAKAKAKNQTALNALAKKKLPEAKKIKTLLDSLPEAILESLYSSRYRRSSTNAMEIAYKLVEREDLETVDKGELEADVVLAANGCTTMAALCRKLDI